MDDVFSVAARKTRKVLLKLFIPECEPSKIIQQAVSSLSWLQRILLLTQASSNEVALEDNSVGIKPI